MNYQRLKLTNLAVFFVASACLAATPTAAATDSVSVSSAIKESVPVAKDLTNIFFFVVIATIGILSYLQARKTLFTPIKTETFKLQLKSFEELLMYFEKLRRDSVDQVFDLDRIFHLNAMRLLDDYIRQFFKEQLKIDEEKRKDAFKDLTGGVASAKDFMEKFERVDDYIQKDKVENQPDITNPAVILARWQKHRHAPIEFTAVFQNQMDQLDRFIASPLLPAKLKELLRDFQQKVQNNLFTVGEILTKAAKELPEKYPTPEQVTKAQFHWLRNRYVDKRALLTEERDNILNFVSKYLQIDTLLD